ncbi:exosortase-dependent surface protein XDP1 [Colwellia sp. RE-S-Sl-9]
MLLNISKLSMAGLALMSASAFASTTNFGSVSDTGNNFNQFSVVSDGVTINVSGWSDTASFSGGSSANPLTGDDKIERARDFDKNGNGWSMENRDESKSNGTQKTWVDGYSHSADNLSAGSQDYDTYLLEFSVAVNLSEATYSWNLGNTSNNQVTVAALSSNNLNGNSWANVKSNQTISSGYSQMQDTGGYYTTSFTNATSNVTGTYSQYWIISALNSVFSSTDTSGLEGNDGMKLSGVSFSKDPGTPPPPSTSVPEPTSITMFGLALIGLFAANRRKIK